MRTFIQQPKIFHINLTLAFIAIIVLVGYVGIANYQLSQSYRFEVLKHRLDQMNALTDTTNQEIADANSVQALNSFAGAIGMVEAKDVYSLFQDSGVALSTLK